jgi:hypothetical protein
MVSVVLLFDGFVLSFGLFSICFWFFFVSAILLKAEFGFHNEPEDREQYCESQLNPTNDFHDKFILVVVVSEVGCFFNGVMIDNNEVEHEGAYKVGDISGSFPDAIDQSGCNGQVELLSTLSQGFQLQVIQLVVLFNLLLYVLVVTEQRNQLVSLRVPAHLKHNRVLSVLC